MRVNNPKQRAILKTITWRIIASVTTFILAIIFFGDSPNAKEKAASIAVIEIVVKMVFYYFHERVWQKSNNISEYVNTPSSEPPIFANKEIRDITSRRLGEFIKKNRRDIIESRKENDHMTLNGKILVNKARKEVGYSSNTSSLDIYRTLIMSI